MVFGFSNGAVTGGKAWFGMALAIALMWTGTALADPIPAKDSGSIYFNYSLGFSDGSLYLYSGNTIYAVDLSDVNNPLFASHMTGIQSAFAGPARIAEGGMYFGGNGQAFITMGYQSGGALKVDLNNQTTSQVTGYDDDNVYSAAVRSDGTVYTQVGSFDFSFATRIDRVADSLAITSGVTDPNDLASGGMAFDGSGNLIIGTYDWVGQLAKFYRVSAADLAADEADASFNVNLEFLGSASANGNVSLVVGSDGTIYFNTLTGIGAFDPLSMSAINFYGDINDPNLFSYANLPINGLAYDPSLNRLVFAEYDSGDDVYRLQVLAIPEPASVMLLLVGSAMLIRRSRRTTR